MSWRNVVIGRGRRRGPDPGLGPSSASPPVACHAPFASLYLDQRGFARACCMNEYQLLGNVAERSLKEIWQGAEILELRRAMEAHDLSLGCEVCQWQVNEGRPDLAFARNFDELAFTDADPPYPRMIEFSVSNNCNLQCVMCNGEWSSSIRSQREGLEPLPTVYDERFFADLAEFLPHLERAKFLGGEPFLAAETMRVLGMMVDMGLRPRCHVTTNGTQWSPRVERILDMLPVDVAVSLDAATAATYESIRIGSSWDTVQRNLDRFQERAARNHTDVTVTFCLMTVNWHEFGDFCLAADRRGITCAVNNVTQPDHMSLYKSGKDELEEVVAQMQAWADAHADELTLSKATWTGAFDRLVALRDNRREGRIVVGLDARKVNADAPRPWDRGYEQRRAAELAEAAANAQELALRAEQLRLSYVPADATRLLLDHTGVVVAVEPDGPVFGVDPSVFLGRASADLLDIFSEHLSPIADVVLLDKSPDGDAMEAVLADGRRVRVFSTAAANAEGAGIGTWIYLAWGPVAAEPA